MKDIGFDEAYFYPEVYGENGPEFYTKWEWEGNYRPFDTTFVKDSIDVASFIPKNGEKFYTYWTTMTTHGPYNYGFENINMYKEMGLYDEISEAINDGLYELPISAGENAIVLVSYIEYGDNGVANIADYRMKKFIKEGKFGIIKGGDKG